jgi:hypothetical protein
MKKTILISSFVILVSIFVVAELVQAQGNSDKGPLTKMVFIHYKNPKGRTNNPGKKPNPPQDSGSYTYIASGLKWKTTEDFVLNTTDAPEGTELAIADGMSAWENAAGVTIFRALSSDTTSVVDLSKTDGKNVLVFDELNDNGIIAITYVWGYFNTAPKFREIVEADMIFNTYFNWGDADDDSSLMDVLNIATHEIGHIAGMGDLYDATSTQETMYGYSTEGETIKRTLYKGDIAGISKLY